APNGSLYEVAAQLNFATGNIVTPVLLKLNPVNAATLSSVPLQAFYGAFGISPATSTFFVGSGDEGQIFRLDPLTGTATALPQMTGSSLVGDLDFVVPEPGGMLLAGLGVCVLGLVRKLRTS